ncbi:hypothetical protein M407DRAFT_8715 [Tulasnella calospora MUT 4182]|uniref:Uncharacterized protein n=1 Tax=Tulasnella calospora MUT 4182 TaxID=1051891 RepID=A0A0C3LU54_9AGAM|nr:hypothetical protein M407DRAFT_8715 [Tulasnella calospora MUT 4182]
MSAYPGRQGRSRRYIGRNEKQRGLPTLLPSEPQRLHWPPPPPGVSSLQREMHAALWGSYYSNPDASTDPSSVNSQCQNQDPQPALQFPTPVTPSTGFAGVAAADRSAPWTAPISSQQQQYPNQSADRSNPARGGVRRGSGIRGGRGRR